MRLEEYRKESQEYSKTTSDLIRNFAFAGIAIIWIFKSSDDKLPLIPNELFKPLLFLVITLVFDLLQNFIPSVIWSIFYMYKENNTNPEENTKANRWLTAPGWLLYFCKILSIGFAYYLIIIFLYYKIYPQSS